MSAPTADSGTTIVVRGRTRRASLPLEPDQIARRLVLDGRQRPFDVDGGIYATQLRASGPGRVRGPILVAGSAVLEVDGPGVQRFLGGISCRRSLEAGQPARSPIDSPATSVEGIRFVIRGDVISGDGVTLRDTLVVGSVASPSVDLTNSIVCGHIGAVDGVRTRLRAVCSTIASYDVGELVLEGPTGFMVASGASDHEPVLRDHRTADDQVFSFSMRLLSLCRTKTIGCGLPNRPLNGDESAGEATGHSTPPVPGICCEYWVRSDCPYSRAVSLSRADFVESPPPRPSPPREGTDPSGRPSLADAAPGMRWYFGLQNRALNVAPLAEADLVFDSVLHGVIAYHHLDERGRAAVRNALDSKKLSAQEARLLALSIDGLT